MATTLLMLLLLHTRVLTSKKTGRVIGKSALGDKKTKKKKTRRRRPGDGDASRRKNKLKRENARELRRERAERCPVS